ncbi:MAG: vanadium-dependent haloperoxidase [Thermosynechococcaceae cyanobacterium]
MHSDHAPKRTALIPLASASASSTVNVPNVVFNAGSGNISSLTNLKVHLPFCRPSVDLSVQLGHITLPKTIEFGDQGHVQFIVSNKGRTVARGPIDLNLYISTDDNLDFANGELKNDALLQSRVVNVNLAPGQSKTFTLNYKNLTSVIAPGAYNLIGQVSTPTFTDTKTSNNVVSRQVSARGTNAVVDWNAIALNFIQELGETTEGVAPTFGSRLMAITQTAVFDTVNAFSHTYESYAVKANAPRKASLDAAIAGAASQALTETLSELFPQLSDTITAHFEKQLNRYLQVDVRDPLAREAIGVAFGQSVASQSVALRANDGAFNSDPYVLSGSFPNDYVFALEPGQTALGPFWGKVKPFGISGPDAFAPNGLDGRPILGAPSNNPANALYIQEIEEVRRLGGATDTAITINERTQDQTEIAIFWAYDRADTFRPYGQLYQIAEEISTREGQSVLDSARTFALLGIALADASIAAWQAKYEELQPRPSAVINQFAAIDGFAETIADPDWKPLLGELFPGDNPPFPDYISGHSTFGGAAAGVLSNIFGEDYTFNAVSQELVGVVRQLSFESLAFEDAISRVYGGVHVREASVTDAVPVGNAIGDFVANNLLQALNPEPIVV